MNHILFALWFFLPAGLANAAPVFANKIPWVNHFTTPLDFGKSFHGKRIFGDNKTWRGLIAGVVVGALVSGLQYKIYAHSFGYPNSQTFIFTVGVGALLGLGALLGDAVESCIKRQVGVKPGQHWFPFDQIDYIIGGLVLSALAADLKLLDYVTILVVWFAVHIIATYVGYLVGLRQKPI